jgi:hypothetical protein
MLNLIFRIHMFTTQGSFAAGQYINTYWNDVTELIEVHEFDDAADTTGTVITTGPNIGANFTDYEVFNITKRTRPFTPGSAKSFYTFCEGTTLTHFTHKETFPYSVRVETANHASCSSVVCDLIISSYEVIEASDSVTADGAITVNATSSNGVIHYSMDRDFPYSSGQVSNVFSGLLSGSYSIYAKDEVGCFSEIDVFVDLPKNYGAKYRLEYTDRNNIPTRADIWERGYVGEVIEVWGNDDPFILRYNHQDGLNKFKSIVPSEAQLTLMSLENFFFIDLFTQDERKYQIRYYKNFGETEENQIQLEAFQTRSVSPTEPDWTLGANPSVTVGGVFGSEILWIDFPFIDGNAYTISAVVNYSSGSNFASVMLGVFDNSFNTLHNDTNFINPGSGSTTLVLTFTATLLTKKIGFTATSLLESRTLTIQSIQCVATGIKIKWIGYVISANYKEAYIATPYPVTIIATDGLSDLKTQDFIDASDNKYSGDIITIKAISEILKKTDLQINIIANVNRLEEDMVTSALAECKFDVATFYHDNKISDCFTVLDEILKIFCTRIYQRNGKWLIATIEEAVHEFEYLEYDYNGSFLSSGTIEDIKDITNPIVEIKAAFSNRDQTLEIIPTYGKFFFEHTLLQNASLIKSYSFEREDIFESPEGFNAFKNWNVNISQSPGAEYGIKETKSFEGDFNFYYQRRTGGARLILTSLEGLIEYDVNDLFELKFDYATLLISVQPRSQPPLWVKLQWSLRVGSHYYIESSGGWVTSPKYNDIYVDVYNDPQNFKIVAPFRVVTELTEETLQVEFVFTDDQVFDFEATNPDYSDFEAITTTDKDPGYRIKGKVTYVNARAHVTVKYLYWQLSAEDSATDGLETRRPDDYDATTNQKVWVLQDESVIQRSTDRTSPLNDDPQGELIVNYQYLDNVVLRSLPASTEPPRDITIERLNNANIKVDFEEQYLLNDIDIDNINNSERIYKNYLKKLDGSPTQVWDRTYRVGSGKILELLSDDIVSQYKRQSNKLTGSLVANEEIRYSTILREIFDNGKFYMFMGFELHDKLYSVVFDLAELKDVVNDDTSDEIDAGYTSGFALGFNA